LQIENDMVDQPEIEADPRTYLAAERTLLAWIRTGLAMMGFGFVVARFGLFLRELASMRDLPPQQPVGVSLWIGTALVLFGVAVTIGATLRHWRLVGLLRHGQAIPARPVSLVTIVAALLALLGLCIAGYLVFGLGSAR
jgi:putative membrane protein